MKHQNEQADERDDHEVRNEVILEVILVDVISQVLLVRALSDVSDRNPEVVPPRDGADDVACSFKLVSNQQHSKSKTCATTIVVGQPGSRTLPPERRFCLSRFKAVRIT